jgi:hypothetical protein
MARWANTRIGNRVLSQAEYDQVVGWTLIVNICVYFCWPLVKVLAKILFYLSPGILFIHLYRLCFDASFLSLFDSAATTEIVRNNFIVMIVSAIVIHLCFYILVFLFWLYKRRYSSERDQLECEQPFEEDDGSSELDEYHDNLKKIHKVFSWLCFVIAVVLFFSEYSNLDKRWCIDKEVKDHTACRIAAEEYLFFRDFLVLLKIYTREKDNEKLKEYELRFQNLCRDGDEYDELSCEFRNKVEQILQNEGERQKKTGKN